MSQVCPNLLQPGICALRDCLAYTHDVYYCTECRFVFTTASELSTHRTSLSHPDGSEGCTLDCPLCHIICLSREHYVTHTRSRRHQNALKSSGLSNGIGPVEMDVPPGHRACRICQTIVPEKTWTGHIRGQRHTRLERTHSLENALDDTETDKHGVTVEGDNIDFGVSAFVPGRAINSSESLKFKNTGAVAVVFVEARLSSRQPNQPHGVFHLKNEPRRQLNRTSGTSVTVRLVTDEESGRFEDRLELRFSIPSQKRHFTITRPIFARVGAEADYEALRAARPYERPKRRTAFVYKQSRGIEGIRPAALAEISWANKLGLYDVPKGLSAILSKENTKPSHIINMARTSFMPGAFAADTYVKHFQTMLWIEEEQARRELLRYDLEKATLVPNGIFYELGIEGLAEKRPCVIVGDAIVVRTSGSDATGFVHVVKDKSVLLRFSPKFKGLKGQTYYVHFELNRLVFRRMHQALKCEPSFDRVTFPSSTNTTNLRVISEASANSVQTFDRKISSNPPQLQAVATILHMHPGSVPFVVFGPPGTGKTVTIIEAIRQIVHANPNARILACAPSNSAADLIAERLSALGEKMLIRLVAPSRKPATVSKAVLKLTRVNGSGVFVCPPRDQLEKFNVVVSTCCNASVPFGIGIKRGHFSHIFVDEAGQGTEPEIMIPIKTLIDEKTNIILSGDAKQLGPIVCSAASRELGLGVSYLDRLQQSPLYDEVGGKGLTLIKLIKNWRSHPAILKFPNDEFYRGELEASADPVLTHSICGRWDGLVKKDFPVIFHGVGGKDEREASSPSYFNIDEATIVKAYVKSLLEEKGLRLKPEDIGIISPYHAQVLKIRKLLQPFAKETMVGSVEQYQGQERRVIIISTVRSSADLISFDLRHTLGFVANPRRFNVAVTRAQALLIVVGDPFVLALDPLWKAFINYVHQGGGYRGKRIDWNPAEPVDRTVKFDEARRDQGLTELEELILRTREMQLAESDDEVIETINPRQGEE
ncbi:P-loop containing nucleoside triphosphate hydrolase protein [Phellopilus nigrolimitatus]|nr:P-loop containing nucleoside triphosphate hydrolase protein [Phellopilus nigrolimitatus]